MTRFAVTWQTTLYIPESWARFSYRGQVYRQRDGMIWLESEPRLAWLTRKAKAADGDFLIAERKTLAS
jgi:hypothetical protein